MNPQVISWNVNGIRSRIFNDCIGSKVSKTKDLELKENSPITEVLKYDPEIICFQETRCNKIFGETHVKIPGYNSFFNESNMTDARGPDRYSGTAVFYKHPLEPIKIETQIPGYEDTEGRIIIIHFEHFIIINVYAPNSGTNHDKKQVFITCMLDFLKSISEKFVIFCGDMNIAVDSHFMPSFTEGPSPGFWPFEINFWTQLKEINYIDPIKCDTIYTWWDPRQRKENGMSICRNRNKGWRLDYFFINQKTNHYSSKVLKYIGENNQGIPLASDHAPIILSTNSGSCCTDASATCKLLVTGV
jgi:exodeoxyribonuclease III